MTLTFRLIRGSRRMLCAASALSLLVLSQTGARAAAPIALKSEAVELPADTEALPSAPGIDVVNANCSACHSPGMILNQPPLSKVVWDAEVRKMIKVYKAPIEDRDIDAIVGYLVAVRGAK